jgi:hypothetical protein
VNVAAAVNMILADMAILAVDSNFVKGISAGISAVLLDTCRLLEAFAYHIRGDPIRSLDLRAIQRSLTRSWISIAE